MTLTTEQNTFFQDNGYLPYSRVLMDEEVEALRRRSEEIVHGRMNHVPAEYIQLEVAFRESDDTRTDRLDQVRKMATMTYESVARKSKIVDIIEDLLETSSCIAINSPSYNGTVTD